jgi:hypothetical protein
MSLIAKGILTNTYEGKQIGPDMQRRSVPRFSINFSLFLSQLPSQHASVLLPRVLSKASTERKYGNQLLSSNFCWTETTMPQLELVASLLVQGSFLVKSL